MKKPAIAVLLFFGLMAVLTACKKTSFLDQTVTSSLDEQSTFSDSSNAMQFLNNIYGSIGFATDPRRFSNTAGTFGAGLEAACDEAEGPNAASTNGFIQFATGSVNATVVPDDAWKTCYANIRAVNQFLKHIPVIPFNNALKIQVSAGSAFSARLVLHHADAALWRCSANRRYHLCIGQ